MFTLKAKIRKDFGKKVSMANPSRTLDKIGTKSLKEIRNLGEIPAVVYGREVKNYSIQVDEKEFKKVLREAGESSLVELLLDKDKKLVLIHEIQKSPVSGKIIHIDFFQPSLTEKVEVNVPLVFEGVAPAEKDLGGTLVKNMMEIEVKGLPQNLPHEIKVSIDSLKTFEDHILVKDLFLSKELEILKNPEEIVASVLPPQKVEEELSKEIKEDVEGVEKVEKEKKEEEVVEEPKEDKKENK